MSTGQASRGSALPWRDALLALLVVAVWGTNFVVIKIALGVLPPLLFGALRFLLVALPAIFFLKRPPVAWRNLFAYGQLIGAGQFGLLYIAMRSQISPGLASLVMQLQVVFTIGLAMALAGERVTRVQLLSVALAAAGLGLIAARAGGAATPLGLLLASAAAFCWGAGNMVARHNGRINMLAYVVWASPFSLLSLLLLSWLVEGGPAMLAGLAAAGPGIWLAVLWQSLGNSMFGYALWGWLLARHPAASITPMSLLVPVFGIGASAIFLGEALPLWKLIAAGLVLSGLALNLLWPIWARRHHL